MRKKRQPINIFIQWETHLLSLLPGNTETVTQVLICYPALEVKWSPAGGSNEGRNTYFTLPPFSCDLYYFCSGTEQKPFH